MNSQRILESLAESARPTDIILDILFGGYQESCNMMRKRMPHSTPSEFSEIKREKYGESQRQKHNFYSLLYRLRKQGFIEKSRRGKKNYWRITSAGMSKLDKIKSKIRLPKRFYKKEKDKELNIITFDVPEKYRAKRDWIRYNLIALGFTMLQKSVWAGKIKIPEDFLDDLSRLNLLDFIHIFKVSRKGTIRGY